MFQQCLFCSCEAPWCSVCLGLELSSLLLGNYALDVLRTRVFATLTSVCQMIYFHRFQPSRIEDVAQYDQITHDMALQIIQETLAIPQVCYSFYSEPIFYRLRAFCNFISGHLICFIVRRELNHLLKNPRATSLLRYSFDVADINTSRLLPCSWHVTPTFQRDCFTLNFAKFDLIWQSTATNL